jgi:hypothetical protein
MAIQSYQHAIEALVKLVQIYPEYKLNKVYMERASAYQNRVKALQMSHGLDEERTSVVNELPEKSQTTNGNGKARGQSEASKPSDNAETLRKTTGILE